MSNFFQKGVQFLKIQQIVGLGMHLVIHLWTRLNRNRNQGHKRIIQKFVFPFLSSKIQEGFILQAPVCFLKSHRTRWVILSVVQAELRVAVLRKRPQPGNGESRRGGKAVEAYSRQAVLAVWTGPLSTPSPSQQYNGPVATGSSLHCVSSPGPPQLKWTQAASKSCTRRRGEGERGERGLR